VTIITRLFKWLPDLQHKVAVTSVACRLFSG